MRDSNVMLYIFYFLKFYLARQPPSGPGPPHSRGFLITLNDAPLSVGFFRTTDQPDAETST